ncbi:MAG: DUF5666 domain-containing protein [Thiothrix sp.]
MQLKAWLMTLLLSLLLIACGESELPPLATGGIGGTGISSGPITGFGSIIVNGVKYDIAQATLLRNGQLAAGQFEYRIGEYVTVQGHVNADGLTGTAQEVSFNKELEGIVTSITTDNVHIGIMGQVVRTNALTVFHGFKQLGDLELGNVVEVSGVRDVQDQLLASSITLKQSVYVPGGTLDLKGFVKQLNTANKTFQLGSVNVLYGQATLTNFGNQPLTNGQYVEVKTRQLPQGNGLVAYEVELGDRYVAPFTTGSTVELEGIVTRFVSRQDFSVNRQAIITTANTRFKDGAAATLSLNALVEVKGVINALGVLVADKIEVKESASSKLVKLKGRVSNLEPDTQTLMVAGQTVVTDNFTQWEDDSRYRQPQMGFRYLHIGDYLELQVKPLASGKVLALRVQREDEDD